MYITPSGSQGLAPHHDDVEVCVCIYSNVPLDLVDIFKKIMFRLLKI